MRVYQFRHVGTDAADNDFDYIITATAYGKLLR